MKTSELKGDALDFAVAVAEGWEDFDEDDSGFTWHREKGSAWLTLATFRPSELWEQGGPIIERERISVDAMYDTADWVASLEHTKGFSELTPLIAAMRCHVASKLGEEVDIPRGVA
jgi:hypothetical protein